MVEEEGRQLNSLPSINIGWEQASSLELTYLSSSSAQTLYMIHQLIENNNELLQQMQTLQEQKVHVEEKIKQIESKYVDAVKDLQKKDTQVTKLKGLLQQASKSMTSMEEDYYVLQKQVELLTKKMQSLAQDNERLVALTQGHVSVLHDPLDVSKMKFPPKPPASSSSSFMSMR